MDADFVTQRLLCGAGKNIQLWDLKCRTTFSTDGRYVKPVSCLKRLEGHEKQVSGLVVDWDNSLVVSGSHDMTLRRWNFESAELLQVFGAEYNLEILCLGGNMSDRRIISGDESELKVWDPFSGKCVQTLTGHTDAIISVSRIRTNFLLSGSRDGMLKCWDLREGTCVRTIEASDIRVGGVWVMGVRAEPLAD